MPDYLSDEVREKLQKMLERPQPTGVNDPTLTNAEVNEQVSELIFGGDPNKVDEGLRQLYAYITFVEWNSREKQRPPGLREFSTIPSLKEFLLWRWREGVKESDRIPPKFEPPADFGLEDALEILQDVDKFKAWMASSQLRCGRRFLIY